MKLMIDEAKLDNMNKSVMFVRLLIKSAGNSSKDNTNKPVFTVLIMRIDWNFILACNTETPLVQPILLNATKGYHFRISPKLFP